MSDTPRTDAAEKTWKDEYNNYRECGDPAILGVVDSDVAREMEREVTQLRARLAELENWRISQLSANANMVLVEDERHDQLLAAEVRIAELERILADPASVWANMLTGKIARPQALDHYEECKSMVEKLDEQVRVLKRVAERSNAIEAALRGVLASATPNPRDNPAMATAWKIATDTLNPPNVQGEAQPPAK